MALLISRFRSRRRRRFFDSHYHVSIALLILLSVSFGGRTGRIAVVSSFYMNRVPSREFARTPGLYDDVPVVVEQVLTTKEVDQWLNKVFENGKEEEIVVQFSKDHSCTSMTLTKATDLIVQNSNHGDPIYCSSIGKTSSPIFTQDIPLEELMESLFDNDYTRDEDHLDWFKAVKQYAPVHDTLVLAGEGSTSPVIQCHAYTKLLLCVDGSQLIRILPPLRDQPNDMIRDGATPTFLESWRGFPVSNGYRANSHHDLFAYRHRDVSWEIELFDDDNQGPTTTNRYDQFYQHWAEDPNVFHPNFEVSGNTPTSGVGAQNHHDLWHSTVALPGDLVVIPPGWWYQTYNVEPSVTLSSQRCGGSYMASRFIHHALEASGVDRMLQLNKDGKHTEEEALTIVSGLFEVLDEHYSSKAFGGGGKNHSSGFF